MDHEYEHKRVHDIAALLESKRMPPDSPSSNKTGDERTKTLPRAGTARIKSHCENPVCQKDRIGSSRGREVAQTSSPFGSPPLKHHGEVNKKSSVLFYLIKE